MLTRTELLKIARSRLRDAEALMSARRYDGAIYLCGYVIELKLKARICKTLRWSGYPSTRNEFQRYQSFRTHDLDVLLSLSGLETKIKTKFLAEWSVVASWDPEVRYRPVGSTTKKDVELMIESTRSLLRVLS